MSRTITVCGVAPTDPLHDDDFCVLPPEHVEHTTTDNDVCWHKSVKANGSSYSFATTGPNYVRPSITDIVGLFGPEDTRHLCSVHWVRYQRYSDQVAEWWDETCEHCDHDKARPLFDELRSKQ